jgi:ubiquinone biosynthesis protein UbiJ
MMYMYCTLTGVEMPDNNVDLNFIAHQLRQLMTQVGALTDDMRVLTAMVLRLDHGQANLLDEVRAVHGQLARLADRVGKLEATP